MREDQLRHLSGGSRHCQRGFDCLGNLSESSLEVQLVAYAIDKAFALSYVIDRLQVIAQFEDGVSEFMHNDESDVECSKYLAVAAKFFEIIKIQFHWIDVDHRSTRPV